MNRATLERSAGALFLVGFISAHLTFGIVAAVRVLGIACLVTGLVWCFDRSIPVGVEGKPPSFRLQGAGALIAGVAMAALGVVILMYSSQAACVLGWAGEEQCK